MKTNSYELGINVESKHSLPDILGDVASSTDPIYPMIVASRIKNSKYATFHRRISRKNKKIMGEWALGIADDLREERDFLENSGIDIE